MNNYYYINFTKNKSLAVATPSGRQQVTLISSTDFSLPSNENMKAILHYYGDGIETILLHAFALMCQIGSIDK